MAQATIKERKSLSAWLSQEKVFRLIPFIMVEATFLLLLAVPFILTIYISLLKWRANRPFEQAYFHGLLNYVRVLTTEDFWWALGRTFYFAGTAVLLELLFGFLLAMLAYKQFRGRRIYITIFLVPHDGGAGRGRLQLFDDLHRLGTPQPDSVSHHRSDGHKPPYPLALAPHRRAVGDHPRRRMAVDVAHVSDISLGLRRAPAATHQRRTRSGGEAGGRSSGKSISRC